MKQGHGSNKLTAADAVDGAASLTMGPLMKQGRGRNKLTAVDGAPSLTMLLHGVEQLFLTGIRLTSGSSTRP